MTYQRGLIGILVVISLFLYRTTFVMNPSDSLPYPYFLVFKDLPLKRGDFVSIHGHQPLYLPPSRGLIKEIVGLEGDRIERRGGYCYVRGQNIGFIRQKSKAGDTLSPNPFHSIPRGYVFVRGMSWDSYDSRYKEFGLIKQEHLQGRAIPLGGRR